MRLTVFGFVLLAGCVLSNLSASERLRDSVVGLNDELRWQRMDLALGRVSDDYRQEFSESHRDWGRDVIIADVELMGVEMVDGRQEARSMITYRWYRQQSPMLRETTLQQEWRRAGNSYVLVAEEVVGGDTRLIPEPADG